MPALRPPLLSVKGVFPPLPHRCGCIVACTASSSASASLSFWIQLKQVPPLCPHLPRGPSKLVHVCLVPSGSRSSKGPADTHREEGRGRWGFPHLKSSMPTSQPPGGEFLLRHARVAPPGKKCAFVLTRDGRPVKVQRTIFSECFYTMAMNELWRVTGEARYQVRVRKATL